MNRAGGEQGERAEAMATTADSQRGQLESSLERGLDELELGLEHGIERAKQMAAKVTANAHKRSAAAAAREQNMDLRVRDLKPYLQAVADATRLSIMQELARNAEMPVHDISAVLDLSQPLTSWHLLILKRAGLVKTRKVGRQVMYRLNREKLQERQARFAELMSL